MAVFFIPLEEFVQTVCLDFDQTLHPYTKGYTGPVPEDEPPIPGAKQFIQTLIAKGYRLIIQSARCNHPGGAEAIWAWLRKYGLAQYISEVTNVKPPAVAYVDDRGVHFDGKNYFQVLQKIDALSKKERQHAGRDVPPAS